ncbi:hypothetical protein A7P53_00880 [Acinetobacter defluvii]|uniref:LPS translocon maturation chaperone LptM n=1 Tax=Acinetobacter defluvii TaxID=1871111 RepID=UPI00148F799D|nr:lipoprotein [Acinetobacter defluvii]NNP72464.1 hypothetical protein [Acinetobacter defluvii]
MRRVICYISVMAMATVLLGCGQSGDLQLPNDPNYDNRAKYLLYPNTENKATTSEQKVVATLDAPTASQATTN